MCWTTDGSGNGTGNCFGVGGTSAAAPSVCRAGDSVKSLPGIERAYKAQRQARAILNPGAVPHVAICFRPRSTDVTIGDNIVPCAAGSIDCVERVFSGLALEPDTTR